MLLSLVGRAQRWALWPEARRFHAALQQPAAVQRNLLMDIVIHNAGTAYGRAHGFAQITGVADFRERVPVVDYDAIEPYVARMRTGEQGVLTADPLVMFERSAGSSGASKTIPYTAALLRQFQRATSAWAWDLFTKHPVLRRTTQYWSVSPGGPRGEVTEGGTPIGLEDDTAYLGFLARQATRVILAVPGEVSRLESMEACRAATARYLLADSRLGFISVWSPTFLTLLLQYIEANWTELYRTLPRSRKARLSSSRFEPRQVWPQLSLVSCWTSGPSARFVPELRRRLPDVPIQAKGLLATEGVVSFPLTGQPGAVPAVTSHYLELVDAEGRARCLHEAELGAEYRPLITTAGGLYRYDLRDQVRVVGRHQGVPLLEFVGRSDGGSDQCGEKLTPGRVEAIIQALGDFSFAMLTPGDSELPGYILWVEGPSPDPAQLEALLREGHHYDRCRALGQLAPARIYCIDGGAARFEAGCMARGQRAGELKPTALHPALDWVRWMAP